MLLKWSLTHPGYSNTKNADGLCDDRRIYMNTMTGKLNYSDISFLLCFPVDFSFDTSKNIFHLIMYKALESTNNF
jgi:hypothetical protein